MVVENFETFPEDVQSQIKSIVSKYTNAENVKVLDDASVETYTHNNTSIQGSVKQNDISMRQNDQDSKMKTVMAAQAEYRNIDDLINNIYAKIERAKYH